MPTYEYECPDGHHFEKFYRKISDAQGEVACPRCGQNAERLISAGAGLIFKGSGFYITDYGKDGKKAETAAAAAAAGGGDKSGASEGGSEPRGGGAGEGSAPEKSEAQPVSNSASADGKSSGGDSKSAAPATAKGTPDSGASGAQAGKRQPGEKKAKDSKQSGTGSSPSE
ncbi:MAG: FmdB family zinc ribbon protein [Gemmatimonadaceae bacterium]